MTHIRAAESRFYAAFYAWFKQGGCDFWSESNASEDLATIAISIADEMCAAARRAGELAMRERCALIAKDARSQASINRHHNADGADKSNWLWAFDTANGIEGDIRALEPEATA